MTGRDGRTDSQTPLVMTGRPRTAPGGPGAGVVAELLAAAPVKLIVFLIPREKRSYLVRLNIGSLETIITYLIVLWSGL